MRVRVNGDSRVAVVAAPRQPGTGRTGGTARRFAHAGGDREDDGPVRGDGLEHRPGTEGRRDGRGHAHLGGRPPGPQRLAERGRRHRHRRGLRPHPPARRGRQPRPPGARRGVRAAGRGRLLGPGLRPGGTAGQPPDRGHRRGPRQDRRGGPGRAGPDRRGVRDAGLDRHPARLGRHPARRGAAGRLGVPVHVDNDANLGALGELVWGGGRGCGTWRTSRSPAVSAPGW